MEYMRTQASIEKFVIITMRDGRKKFFDRRRRMIYTVFPKQEGEMPQDFPTYSDAQEYGDEEFGRGNYTIESTTGECV